MTESDFETRIRKLHAANPTIALDRALRQIDGNVDSLTNASMQARAEWVLEQPFIVSLLMDKKIHAIKEVRALTQLDLRDAKDAVELAAALHKQGYLNAAERRQLEIEEKAAIASILNS